MSLKDSETFGPEHHRNKPRKHTCKAAFFLHFLYKMYFNMYEGVAILVKSTLFSKIKIAAISINDVISHNVMKSLFQAIQISPIFLSTL